MLLSRKEHRQFYKGFSNEIIWPIFHDLQTMCNFNPEYWKSYLAVNRKFADSVSSLLNPDDFVWVHDYHLMCFAGELRCMENECPCAFFTFLFLPWTSSQTPLAAGAPQGTSGFRLGALPDREGSAQFLGVLASHCAKRLDPRKRKGDRRFLTRQGSENRSISHLHRFRPFRRGC